jgi:hypothetical protein
MIWVPKHELVRGQYYIGYFNGEVLSGRTRKLFFVFVMDKYSDSVNPKFAVSISHDMDSHYPSLIKEEHRLIALGKYMDFFELTSEEFLMLTVGEMV